MYKLRNKRNNGITLIALVITIIVLLILAAISITMLTGDNSILKRAVDAKKATDETTAKEQIQIEVLGSYGNDGRIDLDKLKSNLANIGATVIGDELPIIAQLNGYTYEIDEDLNLSYIEDFVLDTNIPEDAVAKMNYKYYTTLQGAIDKVGTNNKKTTILLLKDISENVTVATNKNIVLNLDNHKMQNANNTPIISLSGTIQVKNGSIQGTYSEANPCILVNPNSEIDFSNTNVSRNSDDAYLKETVELHGTLKIDSGKIENTNSCAICSYTDSAVNMEISGTAEIYSSATGNVTLYNNTTGYTKITGGKISSKNSNPIRQEGILEISGGKISSTQRSAISNKGKLEISGTAEIEGTASNYATIYTYAGSETTITGGKVTAAKSVAIQHNGKLEISGTAEIEGTSGPTIYTYAESKTTISGGKIISNNETIRNKGNLEISGGDIEGSGEAIYNEALLEIRGGNISSSHYTLCLKSGSETKISGGNILSTQHMTIKNEGTLEINGTAIISRTYDDTQSGYDLTGTIWNSGTTNILAGQIFADKGIALSNYGTMTIGSSAYISSGSTDKKYPTAELHTNITLNGGKIENTAGGYAIIGFSKLTNNGGTVIGLTD